MRRGAVEVEVILLDVLPVVALAVGQAEQPLLEDGVFAVPQGQGEAEALLVVADAGQAVLAPAVSAAARLVVGEVVPGVAALAVVLAHRPPLALAQVRPPLLPGNLLEPRLVKSVVFGSHRGTHFLLRRQAEQSFVMARYGFQFRPLGRGERLALVPGVFGGRQAPEGTFVI